MVENDHTIKWSTEDIQNFKEDAQKIYDDSMKVDESLHPDFRLLQNEE